VAHVPSLAEDGARSPRGGLVRIFVSSTFRDMHAERDHLNRIVWPELRHRCLQRGVDLVSVDLRWGVTEEDSVRHGALALCLQEIDRCDWFVALIGDRYGWIPPAVEGVPGAAGRSITELEIRHALQTKASSRLRFCLRDTRAAPGCEALAAMLAEPDEAGRRRLRVLRQWIELQAVGMTRHYDAVVEGQRLTPALLPARLTGAERRALDDDVVRPQEQTRLGPNLRALLLRHGTVALGGLDAWGQVLCEDLWSAIESELGAARTPEIDSRAAHERYLFERTRLFVGRDETLVRVLAYVRTAAGKMLVVSGEPGSGKSALLAEAARRCREAWPQALVLPHFIGAAPGSAVPQATVRALCGALQPAAGDDTPPPADRETLYAHFTALLAKAARAAPVVLFIDALDQLDIPDIAWLPSALPAGVALVVSTLPGPLLERLRPPAAEALPLPQLAAGERAALVDRLLELRGKRLTAPQRQALLDSRQRPAAALPLYLWVAVEELSLFGHHEAVDVRIDTLPSSLEELFDQVLTRIEQDHGRSLAQQVLGLIAASRSGLLEPEILDLLQSRDPGFARLHWIRLYRALAFYLRPMDEASGDGLLAFFHGQMVQAVRRRCLGLGGAARTSPRWKSAHRQLAAHFEASARSALTGWQAQRARALNELPIHRARAGDVAALRALLLDFGFLQAKVTAVGPQPLVDDFDLLPPAQALRPLQDGLRLAAVVLQGDPDQLASQLLGRLLDEPDAAVQQVLAAARTAPGGLLLPRSASLAAPGGGRVRVLAAEGAAPQVAISSDGYRVLAIVQQWLGVWNVASGRLERRLAAAATPLLALSPDGRIVASSNGQGQIELRDVDSGALLHALTALPGAPQRAAFSADGLHLVSGHGPADATQRVKPVLCVWDVATGALRRKIALDGHGAIKALALAGDGVHAVVAADGFTAEIRRLDTGERRHELRHDMFVMAVAVLDDVRVLTAPSDGRFALWDLHSGRLLRRFKVPAKRTTRVQPYANSIAVARGANQALFALMDGTLRVWNTARGRFGPVLQGHADDVLGVAVTPDAALAVSADVNGSLRVWRPAEREAAAPTPGHGGRITSLAFTPDGTQLLSASWDHEVGIWDSATGRRLGRWQGHAESVNSVQVTVDGRRVVTTSSDGTLKCWRFSDGRMEGSARMSGSRGEWPTERLAHLFPDGRSVAAASSGQCLARIRLPSGTLVWTRATEDLVRYVAVTDNGRRVLACAGDVKVFDANTGQSLRTLRTEERNAEVVAPLRGDTRALVGYTDGRVRLWSLAAGKPLFTTHEHGDAVVAIGTTPDGRYAVSGDRAGLLHVWDLAARVLHATLRGHKDRIWQLAISPDGRWCASASGDGTLRVWGLPEGLPAGCFTTEGTVWACVFADGSRILAAGGDSGRVHLLDLGVARDAAFAEPSG